MYTYLFVSPEHIACQDERRKGLTHVYSANKPKRRDTKRQAKTAQGRDNTRKVKEEERAIGERSADKNWRFDYSETKDSFVGVERP